MTDQQFTDAERAGLATIAGLIIPASEEHGVPGADDPAILAEIVEAAAPLRAKLSEALAAVDDLEGDSAAARGAQFRQSFPAAARLIQTLVVECYYRDARVMIALGMEPRPPFPLGYEIEQGDWSLLDPVRARPPMWRRG